MRKIIIHICLCILLCEWNAAVAQSVSESAELNPDQSLTFFASFDDSFEAAFSQGDPNLYIAPGWEEKQKTMERYSGFDQLEIRQNEGRYGDALWVNNTDRPVFFYRGKDNIFYSESNWEGTVSFWLRLSPDEDLAEGYSDPIQLTDSAWNDGALYVDFTTQTPRTFRFAFFAEREIWDPQLRDWEEIPVEERPMVEVVENIFSRDHWVHIAFSFRNFNTGVKNGIVDCYINGKFYDSLSGREQTLRWDIDNAAIWLGYNYTGYFDELALFNRALSAEEIQYIYSLSNGIGSLSPTK